MFVYEEIRDELKKHRYVIYKVENNKTELAFKFNGKKSELKEKLIKKYLKKNTPTLFFVCFKFSFHTGTKQFQGGPVAVDLSTYAFIDDKLINGYDKDESNQRFMHKVWFPRIFLEKYGWKDGYLDKIVTVILANKLKMLPLVTTTYINFMYK
jgi:thioredoxin-related protein